MDKKSAYALILFFLGSFAFAANSPGKFSVLRSAHFELIYREGQREIANRYALAAEQAYELLLPVFKEAPEKTIVILKDDTDNTNGEATFLPYPMITVFPVLPSTLDSIDDYGDWPLEIMVHEYTHILNMYPAHGFYVPLKYIFGSVVRPNAVLPKWYLEGLAVNLESRLTDHGRLRAIETHAAARALTLGGNLVEETLPRINEQELSTWPYGGRPYLFGAWWWNHVQGSNDIRVIEAWNQNYSRRVPFFINGPMKEYSKKSAEELLDSSADALEKEARVELQAIRESKPHTVTSIAQDKGEIRVFAISPSGKKLVYFAHRPSLATEVRIKARSDIHQPFSKIKSKLLFKTLGGLRLRWLDENHFVFDAIDDSKPIVQYSDLFQYDLSKKHRERLTTGLRAEEPAPSLDGKLIAFIQNDAGRNRLMLLENGQAKILIEGDFTQRLSGPEFLNNDQLLYVLHERSGLEQIYSYSLKDKKAAPWISDLKSTQNLKRTPKGMLVSDAGTNVRNIYLAGESSTAISNTLTHIETADYDAGRNELIISELTSDGYRLHSIPYSEFKPNTIHPVELAAPPTPKTQTVDLKEESYQPLAYLWPRYWIPFVYTLENNGLLFQGTTSNTDPAGHNSYAASASYDTLTNKPSYGISYTNSSTPTDITTSYAKAVNYLGASNFTVENQAAELNFSQNWPFNRRSIKWNFGGMWMETQGFSFSRRLGPEIGLTYDRLQSPLNIWWGTLAEISQEQFISQAGYLAYGRTYFHLAELFQLGGGNKISLQARAAFSPKIPMTTQLLDVGDRSLGGNYIVNLANSNFLLRGYPSGTFIGRKIVNANLEYAFPLVELAGGWGTFPVFLKAMEIALFTDAMAVDGAAHSEGSGYSRKYLSDYFMGTGAELRFSSTAGYHLPINFTVGAYYGLNTRYDGGFTPFLGFSLGDLGVLQNKTP